MAKEWLVYYNEGEDQFRDNGQTEVDLEQYRLVAEFGVLGDTENLDISIIVADKRNSVTTANVSVVEDGLNNIWNWLNEGSGQEITPYWLCLRSMSVSDVVKDPDGQLWFCASDGWRKVEEINERNV